jgi:hypothetical protein
MKRILFAAISLALAASASAALPKATDVYSKMGFGYNIGNTMEAPSDPTSWGNPFPTKALLDSVKAAGFKTVRIPTAWYSHADTTTNTIHAAWMDSVKTVVDYCIDDGLYCILNIHWDGGWLENNVFDGVHPLTDNTTATSDTAKVIARQKAFWKQIAAAFKGYDEHLIFAGANEPGVNDPWLSSGQVPFTSARMGILKAYEQAFVDVVRATGGNNETRTLIVQAPRTEITLADSLLKDNMPKDPAGSGYMMAEVHFYPYQFSMMKADENWGTQYFYWDGYLSTTDKTHNVGWNVYSKSYTNLDNGIWVDSVFKQMKTDFYDQGIPVVVGEFGAFKRLTQLSGDALRLHLLSRAAFYGKVASSAKANGLVPVAWDNGAEDDMNSTIIRRQKGAKGILDYECLNAMRKAYGLDTIAGNSIDAYVKTSTDTTNKSLYVTYTPSDTGTQGTIRITPSITDWSKYTGAVVRAHISGTTAGSGWYSPDFVVMSGSAWKWTDTHFAKVSSGWADYKFTFSTSASDTADASKSKQKLYIATPTLVDAVVINLYSLGFTGSMTIDYIALVKSNGSLDTLENFNKKLPEVSGNIDSAKLIATPDDANKGASIHSINPSLSASKLLVSTGAGTLSATFSAQQSGMASVVLLNPLGQVIAQKSFMANAGTNSVSFDTKYRGLVLVQVRQNSLLLSVKAVQR